MLPQRRDSCLSIPMSNMKRVLPEDNRRRWYWARRQRTTGSGQPERDLVDTRQRELASRGESVAGLSHDRVKLQAWRSNRVVRTGPSHHRPG